LLLDFNLSANVRLATPRVGGTLPYMAPEQVRLMLGTGPEPDARGDLFSLGVILFELLTGRHPFGPVPTDLPPGELARWLVKRQTMHPSLRRLNPQVDTALASLIERCLAFDPAARLANADELAAALRRRATPWARFLRWTATPPGLL